MLTLIGVYQPCRLVFGVDGDHGIPARSLSTPRQLLEVFGVPLPCTVIFDAALSISRRSSGVSSSVTAPMFSSKRCSLVVPGIGTIQDFWASNQASAI